MNEFDDRFSAAFPQKRRQIVPPGGLSLATPPPGVVPPPVIAPPVRTDVMPGGPPTDPNAPPVRMPSAAAVDAWRNNTPVVAPPEPAASPSMPLVNPQPLPRFPAGGVPPVPNVPSSTGPGGITLNSAPIAPGWAGTVGLPSTPEEAKAFEKGGNYEKLMGGLDEINKGLNPKADNAALAAAAQITPMTSQPNAPNQMAGELMAALMNSKKRGLTLAGR